MSADRFDGGDLGPSSNRLSRRRGPDRPTSSSPSRPCATPSSTGAPPGERIKEIPLAADLGFSRAPVRDALRLLERDGLVELVPNRGAIVPELRAVDVLEVYALRAAIGTLALHKLMLDDETLSGQPVERELARLRKAVERAARTRPPTPTSPTRGGRRAAGLPRAEREFERLTWQVRRFIGALDIDLVDNLPRILAEMQSLHEAIVAGRREHAERIVARKVRALDQRTLVGPARRGLRSSDLWAALTAAPAWLSSRTSCGPSPRSSKTPTCAPPTSATSPGASAVRRGSSSAPATPARSPPCCAHAPRTAPPWSRRAGTPGWSAAASHAAARRCSRRDG